MSATWLRIAHRGASGAAPEHTRPAFERALEIGVDMIELDVRLSQDEALVVLHDRRLERTTSGRGLVRAHPLAALRRLDAGRWFGPEFAGERILTLAEVCRLVGGRARLNVEMKAARAEAPIMARQVVTVLRQQRMLESTVMSSFESATLAAVRACCQEACLGLLWQRPELENAWRLTRRLDLQAIHPHWAVVSPALLAEAHRRGLLVLTWTVNDVQAMRHLVALGVDGVISDFPERFEEIDGGAARALTPPSKTLK